MGPDTSQLGDTYTGIYTLAGCRRVTTNVGQLTRRGTPLRPMGFETNAK